MPGDLFESSTPMARRKVSYNARDTEPLIMKALDTKDME